MIKLTIILHFIVLILFSCKIQGQPDKRKEIIHQFLSFVKASDTLQPYQIVDTAAYFEVQNRFVFHHIIQLAHDKLKNCNSDLKNETIVEDGPLHTKLYTVRLCRGPNGEIIENSFDMLFSFRDFKNPNKISYIDIKAFNNSIKPTIAPKKRDSL